MTFFEQLERQILTKGHVVVKNEDGYYQAFSHFKGEDGDYRVSYWYESIEEAKAEIGATLGYSKEQMNKYAERDNWQIIEAFEIPLQRFKVGDKVLVSKDAKRLCEEVEFDWYGEMDKEATGKIVEIIDVYLSSYRVKTEGGVTYSLPRSALSYPIEEDEVQKAIKLLEEKGIIIEGKIIK